MRSVPVFMYHHVNWHTGDLVTLTPDDFENHLRVIQDRKIQTVFLGELVEWMERSKQLPQPSVALTFDDGHLDNWVYAFPLLKKYRMKATIFVITSWMERGKIRNTWDPIERNTEKLPPIPRHGEARRRAEAGDLSVALHWEEAQAMEASGLVDIQCHTHFHQDYFQPVGQHLQIEPGGENRLLQDLERSKSLIEEMLGKNCRFLAWPWGKYNGTAIQLAKKAGFEGLATTEKGVNPPGGDPMTIKRVVAKSGNPRWFQQRVQIYSHRILGTVYSRVAGKI